MSASRGTAPTPVILVHGLRVSGGSLHRIADGVIGRPVSHPDLPGHGTRRAERFTIDGAVATVLDEVERLGGAPAVIAGMSMGGYVAMAAAGRHPDAVAGVMPMCATTQPSRPLAAPFEAFGAATRFLPKEAGAISRALTRFAVGRQVSEDMEIGGLALESIADVVAELKAFDALDEIAGYPGPIHFVNGGWDQFRIHEKRFVAVSAQARLTVLPRATHLFPLIQPERVGAMIDDFAAEVDAGAVVDVVGAGADTD